MATKLCWRMETSDNMGWGKGKLICDLGSKWLIGNKNLLSFWHDRWLNEGTIRSLVKDPLNRGEDKVTVTDLMHNGTWAMDNISLELLADLLRAIKATPIHRSARREDQRCWVSSANGEFDLKSAYFLAINDDLSIQDFVGMWLWKLCTLPKIKIFLWKCYHNSLPVNAILEHRGVEGLGGCRSCLDLNKTIDHVLRDCLEAQRFWRQANCPFPLW